MNATVTIKMNVLRNKLLQRVCDESDDLLVLIEKEHQSQVANTLVTVKRADDQLQALHLTERCRVSKHMDVLYRHNKP